MASETSVNTARSPIRRLTFSNMTTGVRATRARDGLASGSTVYIKKATVEIFRRLGAEYEHSRIRCEPARAAQPVERNPDRRASQVSNSARFADDSFGRQAEVGSAKCRQPAVHLMRQEPVDRA